MQTSRILAFAAAVAVAPLMVSAAARAADPGSMNIVRGTCDASSHTAEGPIDTDLSGRRSRFFCDTAVINMLSDYKGHVMVQFAQKESHHSPLLGFAGRLDDDGQMVTLQHVYLTPNVPTTVSEGYCKFFFKNRHMVGIFCGMKVDETGQRTTAIIAFNAAPGQ